ncbi:MAG: TIGR03067 domain-containing protein [Planctomycetota bacterium]|nr:MAG: TIGR03067 domain-containing protein [Planctomycetota bacterium]
MRFVLAAALLFTCSLALLAADEVSQAEKQEIAKWQGTWKAISMTHDGEETPKKKLEPIKLTVEGDNYHFQNGDFHERGTYRFYPEKDPKALDIVVGEGADKGKVYLVIYKVEGDELTICLESANEKRPTEFSGEAGTGCVLEVWRRQKH